MEPLAGDVVLAHSNGLMGRAIRFAEKLRWRKGSYWNHTCIVNRKDENGVWYVIQADIRGVNEARLDSVGEHQLVDLPEGVDTHKVLEFTRAQLGTGYSILSIISIMFDIVTPNWFPEFRKDNTWICSAVTAEALRYGGWLKNWGSIYTVTPSQLATALNATE